MVHLVRKQYDHRERTKCALAFGLCIDKDIPQVASQAFNTCTGSLGLLTKLARDSPQGYSPQGCTPRNSEKFMRRAVYYKVYVLKCF